ncbi:MAG: hypothetical protein ACO3NK_08455 [Prochlorotrichaceae cyanobacterium]|jgi:hypothetical protein
MLDPNYIPPVEDDELLARYATQKGHFRSSDGIARPSLFIPHPHQELSVTRHREATEAEIWVAGRKVATAQGRQIYGRCDIQARACQFASIKVIAKPTESNPNHADHADIEGWPAKKEDQKLIAQKLVAAATKLIPPPSEI